MELTEQMRIGKALLHLNRDLLSFEVTLFSPFRRSGSSGFSFWQAFFIRGLECAYEFLLDHLLTLEWSMVFVFSV